MRIHFTLYSIIISATLFSCTKEVTELPPATQTGVHTFGCKVDGRFWVPAGFGPFPTADLLVAKRFPNGFFYINARNFSSSPIETEFEFFIKNLTVPGTYLLNTDVVYPTTAANYVYYVKRNINPQQEWLTSVQYGGSITITAIDTVNQFVSGTFQFNAASQYADPQPLAVTEGRFDVSTRQ
jgi:Family of unknown function (DUF6252)